LCSPRGLFRKPQAGIELRDTGDFSFLAWDETGRLQRFRGMENEGTWALVATSAMNGRPTFQVTYSLMGTIYSVLQVTDTGMLRIDNNGIDYYQYVGAGSIIDQAR